MIDNEPIPESNTATGLVIIRLRFSFSSINGCHRFVGVLPIYIRPYFSSKQAFLLQPQIRINKVRIE